jgi:hypothetical protein
MTLLPRRCCGGNAAYGRPAGSAIGQEKLGYDGSEVSIAEHVPP